VSITTHSTLDEPPERRQSALLREEERRRRLDTNKRLATGLLALMALILIATFLVDQPNSWVLLVRAAAEAGVVGGLADWFAVTALFHRPLGLPIPHTAIIPNSKERIGQALSQFVEENFLTRDIVLRRLTSAEPGLRLANWLAEPRTAKLVAGWIASAVPALFQSLDNVELRDFLQRALGDRLRNADLSPVFARLLRLLTASEQSQAVFDAAIAAALRWLETNQADIERLVHEHSRWWVPKRVNRQVAKAVMDGLRDLLVELSDPVSEIRAKFRQDIAGLIEDMLNSPERRRAVNTAVQRALSSTEVQCWAGAVWTSFREAVARDLEDSGSPARQALEQGITSFGRGMARDPVMIAHVDAAFRHLALVLVRRRSAIASVISEVVRSWDARTIAARLELAVGSDLQYIRMNGTVVGAGVGCAIYLIGLALGAHP
jgi:uncharacterized membrane-anchored protein YjiN (DUF445 family)